MDDRDEVARELRQGVTRLARRLRGSRPADGLSAAKIGVLAHLARHGPSTPGEIADADAQRPQALTRVFAELESDQLITRTPSDRDARAVVLSPTTAGLAALDRDMRTRDRWLAAALADLGETEVGLLRLVAPLLDTLADRPVRPPQEDP